MIEQYRYIKLYIVIIRNILFPVQFVWVQSCVVQFCGGLILCGAILWGFNPMQSLQSCAGAISWGCNPVQVQSRVGCNPVGAILCGWNPVGRIPLGAIPCRCIPAIPCGCNPVRVQSRAAAIPCGCNPLGVQSCAGAIR